MVRTREAAAMISEVTPKTADNLTGEWRYRILDTRRQPTEEGRLWIRTNGSMVQGVLETPTHRRDLLTGNLTEEGRVLRLVRMSGPKATQRLRLGQRGAVYAGTIEGTPERMSTMNVVTFISRVFRPYSTR